MAWKKPDLTAPIVTFTPPPDDPPGSSFDFKPNVLTKKRLETFNVRQNVNVPRGVFADGDDGFESLNGYNSNGSDGDNKTKEAKTKDEANLKGEPLESNEAESQAPIDNVDKERDKVFVIKKLKKEDDEKSLDPDSDAANPASLPSEGKRVGVRFRSSWVQRDSSEDEFTVKKKDKVKTIQYFI